MVKKMADYARAACALGSGVNPDWFHPDDKSLYINAKAVCALCPIQGACLVDHIDEPDGMWGGHDPTERRDLREGRMVPRPRAPMRVPAWYPQYGPALEAIARGESWQDVQDDHGVTRKRLLQEIRRRVAV